MSDDKEEFHPLKVAELMKKDLATLESYETRRDIVEYLKDQFVANRLEVSNNQEKLRNATIDALIEKVEEGKIPVRTLLQIFTETTKGGEGDLAALLGSGKQGGVNLQINNTPQSNTVVNTESGDGNKAAPNIKDLGNMLEAMQTISSNIPLDQAKEMKEIIDVTPERKDDE